MKIPGDPSCWACSHCYQDVEGDLHCDRDGRSIFPRDEVMQALTCGSFISVADVDDVKEGANE